MSEHRIVSSSSTNDPRSSLRQSVLVVCVVGALFTAISTSFESQRSVARMAASGLDSLGATSTAGATSDSCSAR